MAGDLKPCPFCGGEAERITLDDEDNFGGDVICCTVCQCSSHVEFGRKENLVDRWNTRPSPAPEAGGVEPLAWRWRPDESGAWTLLYSEPATGISEPLYATPQPAQVSEGIVASLAKVLHECLVHQDVTGYLDSKIDATVLAMAAIAALQSSRKAG